MGFSSAYFNQGRSRSKRSRSKSFSTFGKARLAEFSFMLSFSTFGGTRLVKFPKAPPLLVLAFSETQEFCYQIVLEFQVKVILHKHMDKISQLKP
jgi:hypothetical protein